MRKEEFCKILGDISENYIIEARAERKAKKTAWTKWGGLAACLCLVVLGVFIAQRLGTLGADIKQPGEPKLVINEVGDTIHSDMDVQISHYNDLSPAEWEAVMQEFKNSIGWSYEEFIKKWPAAYQSTAFYSVDAPTTPKGTEYIPHDYVFAFLTESGGTVEIAICAGEEPLRDCFFVCDNPKESEINGTAVVIYGVQGGFMAQFSYDNVYYDIEMCNTTLQELENLLTCIIN